MPEAKEKEKNMKHTLISSNTVILNVMKCCFHYLRVVPLRKVGEWGLHGLHGFIKKRTNDIRAGRGESNLRS